MQNNGTLLVLPICGQHRQVVNLTGFTVVIKWDIVRDVYVPSIKLSVLMLCAWSWWICLVMRVQLRNMWLPQISVHIFQMGRLMVFWDVSHGEEHAVSSLLIGQWTEILINTHVCGVGTCKMYSGQIHAHRVPNTTIPTNYFPLHQNYTSKSFMFQPLYDTVRETEYKEAYGMLFTKSRPLQCRLFESFKASVT
jgi:hypothetical protein